MAVDRLNRKQVACKVVKLKTSGSGQSVSRHFENDDCNGMRGTKPDTQMRSYENTLRREVDMLKGLSHVRARSTLVSWDIAN